MGLSPWGANQAWKHPNVDKEAGAAAPYGTPPTNSDSDSDAEVYSSEKTEVEYSGEKFRQGKFSILTKFLSVIGAGVDLGVGWKNSYV